MGQCSASCRPDANTQRVDSDAWKFSKSSVKSKRAVSLKPKEIVPVGVLAS